VLTTGAAVSAAPEAVLSLGGVISYDFKRQPAVAAIIPVSAIGAIRRHPLVDYVEPSSRGVWHSQTTPWNVSMVGAASNWTLSTGSGVKLLILDSGTPIGGHRDLSFAVAWRCISGPVSDTTSYGHGTHVAGIAGALDNSVDVIGVAHGVSLWMANVAVGGGPDAAEVACSIDVARANGVFVVNMSFGLTPTTAVTDAINGGYNSDGILFVASAGDTAVSSSVSYPASLSNVIAVTAVDNYYSHASFAPIGSENELAAPGVSILSTSLQYATVCSGYGEYVGYCSGTSMAASHVSAAAALVKARYPGMSNVNVRNRLAATAFDLGSSGHDNTFGYGFLDISKALRMQVTILGPSVVQEGGEASWWLNISGGQSPYSYQWYVNDTPAGTSSSLTITAGSSNFTVRLWSLTTLA